MISLGKIPEEFYPNKFDEIWIIARSIHSISNLIEGYPNVFHMINLAPSEQLFKFYKEMISEKRWTKKIFEDYYIPQYIKELEQNLDAQILLKRLVREGKYKNISLMCFCEREELCHRCIVASILLNNCDAEILCDPSYKEYSLELKYKERR